jgi:hypothetical protein
MTDTEPMQRVELVPPPMATLPIDRQIDQPIESHRIGHGSVDQDVTIPTPRFARGTTPPPIVVPAALPSTEVAPPARWGTIEEIVLLDRSPAVAPLAAEEPLIVPRRSLAPVLIAAGVVVFVGAMTGISLLAGGGSSDGGVAPSPAAAVVEPAPIVVPIAEDDALLDADEFDEVDFEMEPEAVEISDIDARILDLLEAGELPSEPAADPARARPRAPQSQVSKARKGILMLGAKPPCRIVIDGRDTGLMTPQRRLRVPVGAHEITLVNDEYDIRETVNVQVRPGKASRVVKDFSKRLRLGASHSF